MPTLQEIRDSIPVEVTVVDEGLASTTDPDAAAIDGKTKVIVESDIESEVEQVESEETEIKESVEPEKKMISEESHQRALNKQYAKLKEMERKATDAQTKLDALERKENNTPLTEAELEKRADILAQQKAQQMVFGQACDNLASMADKEKPGIDARIKKLAENVDPLPRSIIDSLFEVDNGHSVLNALTEDLDLAAKVYAMTPVKQAIEIGRISDKLKAAKAKKISNAPAPVNGLGGSAKTVATSLPREEDDMDTWFKKREATRAKPQYK